MEGSKALFVHSVARDVTRLVGSRRDGGGKMRPKE